MPKVSKIQSSFRAGQISNSVQGRVEQPQYDTAMKKLQNYIPINQGPLIRRPGTKYVANTILGTVLPYLIPFQFSVSQNYILEFNGGLVRFYTNEGQVITSSNQVTVTGLYGLQPGDPLQFFLAGTRNNSVPNTGETIFNSSLLAAGSVLQLAVPYSQGDLPQIKWSQKYDTLYLYHPSYPLGKIQRTGFNTWDYKQVALQDGPYLPLNSYQSIGDSAKINLTVIGISTQNPATGFATVQTSTGQIIPSITNGSSNLITIQCSSHGFSNGDKVCILGAVGTSEANNVSGSIPTQSAVSQAFWIATNVTNNSFQLANSRFVNAYVGSGVMYPALFQLVTSSSSIFSGSTSSQFWADTHTYAFNGQTVSNRNIGLIFNGVRYWGHINTVFNSARALINFGPQQLSSSTPLVNSSLITAWQLGVYNDINGYPACGTFHQDRLSIGGCPNFPQELDMSVTSQYEIFAASGSNLQVNANNAIQFNLTSQEQNAIKWLQSNPQGLLAGTLASEFSITPTSQGGALSPTNFQAIECTYYGSYDSPSIAVNNSIIFIQRAQRKVRELLYYWQVSGFRAANLSELSESITLPSITRLVNQKEPHPAIWGLRSDGQLVSMTYNRDEVTLQIDVAWAPHQLGGQANASGSSAPYTNSIAVIPSGDGSYDELWMVNQRYINSSVVGTIEYMTKPFDDSFSQEQAYHFDCGGTYDSPVTVTGISIGSSCIVTAPSHGFANSSIVRFYSTVGLNQTIIDPDGNIGVFNQLNYNTFVVASSTTNTFQIFDFQGNAINTNSSSVYVGSSLVRKLVTSISGITWLAGETVGVIADGGIHVNTSITQAGVLNLAYPAAVVQFGYPYNSDGQMLRTKDGSAQGTSIGSNRRVNRVAFMLHNVGDFSFGPSFTKLIPAEFGDAADLADTATPLYTGIYRDGIEATNDQFSDTICFRQSSGLPGQINAIVRFFEENDV